MRELLLRAQGDYVARVDGDDYWLPGKLARQIAYLQTHPHCTAVYTNAVTVDESGRYIGLFNDIGDARLTLANLLRRGNALNNSSVLFRAVNTVGWILFLVGLIGMLLDLVLWSSFGPGYLRRRTTYVDRAAPAYPARRRRVVEDVVEDPAAPPPGY